MARLRRSRFSQTSGLSLRKVSWSSGPFGQTGAIAASTINAFPNTAVAVLDDLTIVRTRGQLLLQLVSASARGEGFRWAFGMCIVSQNAAGVGVTAVPDPLADIAWDGWFVFETGHLDAIDATPDPASPGVAQVIVIDSKAMRKLHLTDTVIAMLSVTEQGTADMQGSLSTWILSKLP